MTKFNPNSSDAVSSNPGNKAKAPIGAGFIQHTTSPERRLRRASIKLIGIRQYKRMTAQMVVPE